MKDAISMLDQGKGEAGSTASRGKGMIIWNVQKCTSTIAGAAALGLKGDQRSYLSAVNVESSKADYSLRAA